MCEKKLSKEEINRYKRAFAIFDVEGEGTITTEVILYLTNPLFCLSKLAAY